MKSYLARYHRTSDTDSRLVIRSILFYLAGMLIGYLSGYLLRNSLYSTVRETYENLLSGIASTKIPVFPLCMFCFKQHCKRYVLLLFFSCTNVWLLYLSGYLLYRGFTAGLLLLFCTILRGVNGIWGFFCFLMPQALLYVPAYLILIQTLHDSGIESPKGLALLHKIPVLLLLLLLLFGGCILESTLNLPLLKWYYGL